MSNQPVPATPQPATPPWRGINHLALVTDDMDATVRFYHGTLGARLVATIGTSQFKHYFFNEIPERFRDKVDVRRFGVGERVVPQPYTQAMFERTQAWMHARKLFDAPSDGGVSSEHAVDS